MATWKVSREIVKIFPHPNPEVLQLELAALDQYQFVVRKGIYKDGDVVIAVPERSLLPDLLADVGDTRKYLSGPLKNRVKSIKLQKELSQGMILPDREDLKDVPIGEDIHERLNITLYEPPIPAQLAGKIQVAELVGFNPHHHDVEQFAINADEFVEGEEVLVTEKCHGSALLAIVRPDGLEMISSKGMFHRGFTIQEDETNSYWKAARSTKLFELIKAEFPNQFVQVWGELIPCQFLKYGLTEPTVKLFRVEVEGRILPYDEVPESFKKLWVPLLYRGPFSKDIIKYREGSEQVSGRALHMREGGVVSPVIPRRARKGFALYLKIINPAYKEIGEEIN